MVIEKIIKSCQFCPPADLSPQRIWKNRYWTVIVSRRPLNRGHVILFLNRHLTSLAKLSAQETRALFLATDRIARLLIRHYRISGWQLLVNNGRSAGQSIPHIHFHFIPRYNSEKRSPLLPLVSRKVYRELHALTPMQIRKATRSLKVVLSSR